MADKKAKGMVGILLRGGECTEIPSGKKHYTPPVFRVYKNKTKDNFIDYNIYHNDLLIEIHDNDAEVKDLGNGKFCIDYSDQTLGTNDKS